MKLIRQTAQTCGQACVAMVTGVSLQESIDRLFGGRRGPTEYRDMRRAFRRMGWKLERSVWPSLYHNGILPRMALVAVYDRGELGHWVMIKNGIIYDPGMRKVMRVRGNPLKRYPYGGEAIESYAALAPMKQKRLTIRR